jgi:hypothetical protein
MTQILKRALPFILAFVFGVAVTAIIGRTSPIRGGYFDNGRPRCNWKSQTVEVWELRDPGTQIRFPMTVRNSHSSMLTLKEQALLARASRDLGQSGPSFVVDYVSPETIDGGGPYTSNVEIWNIPRPPFWDEQDNNHFAPAVRLVSRSPACNTLVRVDLDASGIVSRAEPVPGYGDQCPYLSEILATANQISFRPALRDGVPLTVRMSLMYRSREQ